MPLHILAVSQSKGGFTIFKVNIYLSIDSQDEYISTFCVQAALALTCHWLS